MRYKKLSELFNVSYGTKFDMNKMSSSEKSNIAFISRSSRNNGVVAYVDKFNDIEPLSKGLITVTLGGTYVLSSFVQETPFYTAQNVAVMKSITELTVEQKLYYCMCISKNRFRYSAFGREANRTLKEMLVPDIDELPSWINEADLSCFDGAENSTIQKTISPPVIDETCKLKDLFEIKNGIAATGLNIKKNRFPGCVAYIRPASTNARVIRGFLERSAMDKKHIYPKDSLFVSTNGEGSHSYSYVSIEDFVPNSDVSVLIPKKEMPLEIKLYYAKCISQNRYLFSYGRKPKGKRLASLMLPFINDDEVNQVEHFMKSLRYSINLQ